ncbi:MAG: 50S ribosomal protein L4, partial [Candidatus Thermoplasmatota archaeon]|nr:50S ribosomal protein L4 [Candidatus Thermoplasmatota archaeon]
RAERDWHEKINKKERKVARNSALAATANKEIVQQRGHQVQKDVTVPIIIDDEFEKITKTKEVIQIFEKIGIYDDVLRSENGKHIRAGRGKTRGRKYRVPKSILIITSKATIQKSSQNLSGVDIISPDQLNIEHLAPGGVAGRLVVLTQSALAQLGGAK